MSTSFLIRQIVNAFPTKPVPQPSDILYNEEATYKGSFPVDSELAEIKDFFGNRRWDLVTPHDVFQFRHALSFFSKTALPYYTPAWMTCSLLDQVAVDTAIEDLVGTLGRADVNLWTQEQRHIICGWLIYFKNVPLKERFEEALKKFGCSPK